MRRGSVVAVGLLVAAQLLMGCDLLSGLGSFSVAGLGGAAAGGDGGAGGSGGATAAGDIQFSAVFGETGTTRGLGVAVNSRGEVVVVGATDAPIDLGGGTLYPVSGQEVVIGRMDAHGVHLASRMLTGVGLQDAWDVAVAVDDGVIVAGIAEQELIAAGTPIFDDGNAGFVVKLTPDELSVAWEVHLPGDVVVASVSVAPDGSIYACGWFRGSVSFPSGAMNAAAVDGFVMKLAADGTHLWTRFQGGADEQQSVAVVARPDGGVAVGSQFRGTIDWGLGSFTADEQDASVLALAASGAPLWQTPITGAGRERLRGLAVDQRGVVSLVGTFDQTVVFGEVAATADVDDMFVAQLDESGVLQWGKGLEGTDESTLLRSPIAVDADGNILITGILIAPADFGGGELVPAGGSRDVLALELASDGAHRWSSAWGSTDADYGSSIAFGAHDDAWLVGSFQSAIELNTSYQVTSERSMLLLRVAR